MKQQFSPRGQVDFYTKKSKRNFRPKGWVYYYIEKTNKFSLRAR